MIWASYDWLNKFYSCYMATVIVIVNGRGLGIGTPVIYNTSTHRISLLLTLDLGLHPWSRVIAMISY